MSGSYPNPNPNSRPRMGMALVTFRAQVSEETGEYRVMLIVSRNDEPVLEVSLPIQGLKDNYRHMMDLEERGYTPVESVKVKASSEEGQP